MKREEEISRYTERVMNSLDGMQRAEANPFLYTRVAQALESKRSTPPNKYVVRLAFALCVFTVLNVFTWLHKTESNDSATSQNKSGIEAFAEEYNLNDNNNIQ